MYFNWKMYIKTGVLSFCVGLGMYFLYLRGFILGALVHPKDIQIRSPKLSMGVNVCVNGCLSRC